MLCRTEPFETLEKLFKETGFRFHDRCDFMKYHCLYYALHNKDAVKIFDLLHRYNFPTWTNYRAIEEDSLIHELIYRKHPDSTKLLSMILTNGTLDEIGEMRGTHPWKVLTRLGKRDKTTALSSAITYGMPDDFLDVLISAGSPIHNIALKEKRTPAIAAIMQNRCDLLERFFAMGLDPNAVDGNRRPLLYTACEFANDATVCLLLDHGADLSKTVPFGKENYPMVFLAILEGKEKLATRFRSIGDDGTYRNRYGNGLLSLTGFWAGERETVTPEIIRFVARLFPDTVRFVNKKKETPLHVMIRCNPEADLSSLVALLDTGVDPDAEDKFGKKATEYLDANSTLGRCLTKEELEALFREYSERKRARPPFSPVN